VRKVRFIETKLRAASAVRTLWERTRDAARREGKTPVVILNAEGKPGGLVIAHQADLAAVAAELDPFALGPQPGGRGDSETEAKIDDATRPAGESSTSLIERSAGLDVQIHRADRRRRPGEAQRRTTLGSGASNRV
jgi:hypothetical protein